MAQTTNNNIQTPKVLSILVSLDGLSFCVLSFGKITILNAINFEQKLQPNDVLDRLKLALSKEQLLKETFNNLHLTFSNELFTCVPNALYKKDQLTNYLKFSNKLLQTDFADVDDVESFGFKCVYIPFTNISNFLYDQFGEFTYEHSISVFIKSLASKNIKDIVAVNVNSNYYELIVLKDGQLELANRFKYQTKEDFIYYILFTYEELKLDRETFKLMLCGNIEESDEVYELLYTYIRHIEFLDYEGFDAAETLDIKPHHHLLLRHSLL